MKTTQLNERQIAKWQRDWLSEGQAKGFLVGSSAPSIEAPQLQSLSEASCVEYVSIQCAHEGCDQRLGYNFAEDESEEIALDYARFQNGWDLTPAGLACAKHCVDDRRATVIR